jgi:hypothetical protein
VLYAHYSLLLHLHLGDLVTCSVVAGIWLRHAPNAGRPGYAGLVDLYLDRVLIAGERWGEVRPFLESCLGLDPQSRESRANKVGTRPPPGREAQANKVGLAWD